MPESNSQLRSNDSSNPSNFRNVNPERNSLNQFLGPTQSPVQNTNNPQRSLHLIEDPSFGFNDQSNFRNPQEISIERSDRIIPASPPSRSRPVSDLRIEEPPREVEQAAHRSPVLNAQLININPKEENTPVSRKHLEDSTQGIWKELDHNLSSHEKEVEKLIKNVPKENSQVYQETIEKHSKALAEAKQNKQNEKPKEHAKLDLPSASQLFPAHLKTTGNSKFDEFHVNQGGSTNNLLKLFTPELLEKASALEKRKEDMASVTIQDKQNLQALRDDIKNSIEKRRLKPLSAISDLLAPLQNPSVNNCLAWIEQTEQNTITSKVKYLRMVEHAVIVNKEMADQVVHTETNELEAATLEEENIAIHKESELLRQQRDNLLERIDRQRREVDSLHEESLSTLSDAQKQQSVAAKIQALGKLTGLKQRELDNLRDFMQRKLKEFEDYKVDMLLYYRRTGQPLESMGQDFGKSLEKLLNNTVKEYRMPHRY